MTLELIVAHSVRCIQCGFHRYLTQAEADNWKRGEYYSGSHKCPGCEMNQQISAAQWGATVGKDGRPKITGLAPLAQEEQK